MENKKANVISVIIFCLILGALSIAFILKPSKSFSEQENRVLQELPEFTAKNFFDGGYSKKINEYFADQFALRDMFVGIKGVSELAMFKGENNDVLLGDAGVLAVRKFKLYNGKDFTAPADYYYAEVLETQLAAVRRLQEKANGEGLEFAFMSPPRVIDVAAGSFSYPDVISRQINDIIKNGLKTVNYIDLYDLMCEKHNKGEYVYYRTDHHFTSLGAYYAYREVMKSFGMENEIISLSEFDVELASDEFYGTTWSKGGFKFVKPDEVYFYKLRNDKNSYVTVKDGVELDGLYDLSYLEKKDKYSVFLGGNSTRTSLYAAGTEREKLLLVKDSFAMSLAPFLALHFDLEFVNTASLPDVCVIAKELGCSRVLVIYNVENLLTSRYLAYLK